MNSFTSWLLRAAAFLAASGIVRAQSDAFAAPTVITALPVTGTNAGATKESSEPNHGNNAGGASVWYSWTASVTGHYRVDLLNSSYDTTLGVYTGSALTALNVLGLNDDRIGGGTTSAAVVHVRSGETILIAVDGYLGTAAGAVAATGTINLDIVPLPGTEIPPANDLFTNAASLGNTATASATVNTGYGSREVGEPMIENLAGGSSLWWTWTAPADGDVTIDTVGTGFDTLLAVYTGGSLDALTLVASNNNDGTLTTSKVVIAAVTGTEYLIVADARSTGLRIPVGNLTVRIGGGGAPPAGPANDNYSAAALLTTLPVTGTNVSATKETGERNHGNNQGGASVWYSWTAAATGYYRVDLLTSSFDTLLGIYTGPDVASLLPVTQNDDRTGGGTTSASVIYAAGGQQFMIAVDGYRGAAAAAAATGNINLNISPLPAAEVPPANDLFANAAPLGVVSSAQVTVNTQYGSREHGEPLIENVVGATSLWWTWTAPASSEVEITTAGTTFNTLLAVYTGDALNSLTLVASNDNAPGGTTSRVVFNAVAGTQYRIAADVSTAAVTNPSGNLNLRLTSNIYIRTLIAAGSTWSWLHPAGGIDPAIADTDFNTTWYNPAVYNGPAFNPPGGAILGYGVIDYGAIVTNIVDPGSGNRYTAYFRRNFTAADNHPRLRADVLADDGAIIYIDGVERGRANMDTAVADTFTAPALNNLISTETIPVTVDLGTITAGPHEIAVSVHNAGPTSSDLGFDLRLYTDSTPPPVDFVLGPAGASTGFEESVAGSNSYLFGSNGSVELGWTSTGGGTVRAPSSHPAGAGTAPSSQFLSLNGVRANPFRSDRISLAGLTNEQKANITASALVRTFTTSGSTFEVEDDLTISLEGSTDGTVFTVLADILPFTIGGTPDELIAISAVTGDFVQFTTGPGVVPPATTHLRLSALGGNNSASEYIYLDNLRIEIGGGLDPAADADGDGQSNGAEAFAGTDPDDPASVLRVSAATIGAGGLDLTFAGVAGKTYQVEYSTSLSAGWTVLRDDIAAVATGTVDVTGLTLPAGSTGFVRVKVKP